MVAEDISMKEFLKDMALIILGSWIIGIAFALMFLPFILLIKFLG